MASRVLPKLAPDLLTLGAAGKRLGISERTARRMAEAGEFPGDAAIRVSATTWRVSVPKLNRYLHGEQTAVAS